MDAPKDCPVCRLVNPPAAQRCDCGYDFAARRHVGSLLPSSRPVALGPGSVLLLCAALTTFGTVIGAAAGVAIRMRLAEDGTDRCGLWILSVVADGAPGGAVLGGLAGALTPLAIVWLLGRSRRSGRVFET